MLDLEPRLYKVPGGSNLPEQISRGTAAKALLTGQTQQLQRTELALGVRKISTYCFGAFLLRLKTIISN